ncbi:MAG: PEGA domain-containing protein [Polyangiaceae bacterium]
MNRILRVSTGLAFALMLLAARSAKAQPLSEDDTAAVHLKEQGNAEMDALHYDKALEKFEQALGHAKDPTIRASLVYNKGRTLQAMGNYPVALEQFETFDKTAPSELKAKVVGFQQLLEDVRNRVAQVAVKCSVAGAEIRVGERVVGTSQEGTTNVHVNAGRIRLDIRKEGYIPFTKEFDLKGRETQTIQVTLASSATQGALRVESVAGAIARLDGRDLGVVPVDVAIAPGNHTLELSKPGFETTKKSILIANGERRVVKVDELDTPPITKSGWFWVTMGGAVAVVGGAVVGLVVALTTERSPDKGSISPYQVSTGGIRF